MKEGTRIPATQINLKGNMKMSKRIFKTATMAMAITAALFSGALSSSVQRASG